MTLCVTHKIGIWLFCHDTDTGNFYSLHLLGFMAVPSWFGYCCSDRFGIGKLLDSSCFLANWGFTTTLWAKVTKICLLLKEPHYFFYCITRLLRQKNLISKHFMNPLKAKKGCKFELWLIKEPLGIKDTNVHNRFSRNLWNKITQPSEWMQTDIIETNKKFEMG